LNLGCFTQCKRAQFGRSNGLEMKRKLDTLGSVHLGDKFIFRTAEVFGKDFCGRKPSFEGQALTIVRFEPKYKNNIVVLTARIIPGPSSGIFPTDHSSEPFGYAAVM